MSQFTKTVFRSCGLTVGWNMAPPPPGPITLKLPGRGVSPLPLPRRRNAKSAFRRKSAISFLCFPYHSFLFLYWQTSFALSILLSLFIHCLALYFNFQEPGGILVVDLFEDFIRQAQTIKPPPPLRGDFCRCVVEMLVFGFQKSVIDFV